MKLMLLHILDWLLAISILFYCSFIMSYGPSIPLANLISFPHFFFHRLLPFPAKAMHSISTGTPIGNALTATQLLAGLCAKYLPYVSFISLKCAISSRKIFTLMTRSIEEPAASRMAVMLLQQAAVLSPMLPSTSFPSGVPGICPLT